jgi:hypothetical protein
MKQQENEENAKTQHENFQALLGPNTSVSSANSSPLISHE